MLYSYMMLPTVCSHCAHMATGVLTHWYVYQSVAVSGSMGLIQLCY